MNDVLTLEDVKKYLRIDLDLTDDDTFIMTLINGSKLYLANATGKIFDSENELAKLFRLVLITDWYENRDMVGKTSDKIKTTVSSILAQLNYCEGTEFINILPIGVGEEGQVLMQTEEGPQWKHITLDNG